MNRRLSILVVDDDRNQAALLAETLTRLGHSAKGCVSATEALDIIRQQAVHLVITDLRMPNKDGLSFLKTLKETDPEIEVLLITAYASVTSAVDAIRMGALDYMEKPVDINMLAAKIAGIEERVSLRAENRSLKAQLDRAIPGPMLIGRSGAFRTTLERIKRAASSDAAVLLLGESGTGKEVLARLLHNSGKRAIGPFVPINCGAIHENLVESEFFGHVKGAFTGADKPRPGRIEDAEGGTLFLDEIGELPLPLQPKLLRVIQEGEFCRLGSNKIQHSNVRWVAATHRDLQNLVKNGDFREDLYYRLAVLPVEIPPLRERREDIPELVNHILTNRANFYAQPVKRISPDALEA
ncbi:sigma-54-dependent Fis family transcriptional regulator, partial [bacterium]|nr:sigma-54-dependent Fis family transcriptional regulator [bacterium]